MSEGLKEELRGNSILIHDLNDSCIGDIHYRYYTMTSIVAMLNSGLSGKHIIDAGAGEAILTLAAAKLGAVSFDLIENSPDKIVQARNNLKINGLIEGKDYYLHDADLSDILTLAKHLKATARETVIISNIGYWEDLYNVTNKNAVDIIYGMQNSFNVVLFIGAGYCSFESSLESKIKDKRYITNLGFEVDPNEIMWPSIIVPIYAWIARKKISSPLNSLTKQDLGGIDFRAVSKGTQVELNYAPQGEGIRLSTTDLDKKWDILQNMLNAQLTPSKERIKEYLSSSSLCDDYEKEKALSCIADILRLEEQDLEPVDDYLKQALVLLESG